MIGVAIATQEEWNTIIELLEIDKNDLISYPFENPIILKDKYAFDWKEYSKIDNSTSGTFHIIINKIKFLK